MEFIISHRLQWRSISTNDVPFSNSDDMKVLYNDWPYGIDTRIVHLVVWVKFEIEDDPATGYLTPGSTAQIQQYVDETFSSRMNPEHVSTSSTWQENQILILVGHMVQELEKLEKHTSSGAFPRNALRS